MTSLVPFFDKQQDAMDFDEDTIGSSLTIAPGGGDAGGRRAPLLGRIDQYDLLEKLGGGGFRVALVPAD